MVETETVETVEPVELGEPRMVAMRQYIHRLTGNINRYVYFYVYIIYIYYISIYIYYIYT